MPLDYWKASALQLAGGWRSIDLKDVLLLPSELTSVVSYLLPCYLRDLCRRWLQLADGPDFLSRIVNDLAAWATNWSANGSLIEASRDLIHGDSEDDVLVAFGDLLAKLVLTGEVICEPAGFAGELDARTMLRIDATEHRPAGVFLSQQVLPRALRRRDAPIPDPLQITEIVASGPLIEEGEFGGQTGWLLDEKWWTAAVHRHRATKAKLLEIVG